MTEPRHFHSARKGSGSLRPFPIYPLYTRTVILSLDKPIADCFLFRPRKSCERRRKMQSYQRFQHIGCTAFNTSGTNGPRLLSLLKLSTHSLAFKESRTAAHTPKQGAFPSANAERLFTASEIAPSRMTRKSGCTPETCIRFFQYSTVLLSVGQL